MKQQILQNQQQILTPLLVQQMEILTLPLVELRKRIVEEAEKNPLIKLQSPSTIAKTKHRRQSLFTAPDFVFENHVSSRGLWEHILEQIHFAGWGEREEKIAMLLFTSLDRDGFLRQDFTEFVAESDYTAEEIEAVRRKLIKLDPEGIGCRSLLEFLLFQAEEEYGRGSLEALLLKDAPELLEKRQHAILAKLFQVGVAEIEAAIKNLAQLRPTPVLGWGEASMAVIPEAFVDVEGDRITIRLNEYYIPDVRLDQYYVSIYHEKPMGKEEKKFFRSSINNAKALIENLQSRKDIVFRVIYALVEHQKDFFVKGPQYQRPLKLRDIAEEIGVHESTVSRVVKEKYIQVSGRVISLKRFFSSSVKGVNENIASKSIQDVITHIVAQENKTDPLSDEQMVSILANKGIKISRRTVAKYRSILHIPSAFARRTYQ